MRTITVTTWIGLGLAALGAWAFAGSPGSVANSAFFVLDSASAVAVFLAGAALLFAQARSQLQRTAQLTLGTCLVVVAVVGHIASVFGLAAAKMVPAEALAIAFMGFTLIAFHAGRLPAVVRLTWFAMVAAGLFGLASHFLDLGALYNGYADVRIAAFVSIALVASAIGLWVQSHQTAWRERFDTGRDDKKITLIGGAILLGLAISAGFAGFALMASTTPRC